MKKEDVTGIIVYVLILALAIVFGMTVLQSHAANSTLSGAPYIFYVIGAILVGVIFNATMYEIAHLLGAKAGGYLVLSVNILGLCFHKDEKNKTKFKFSSFEGLSGETRILPDPNAKKEPSPRPYLLFGAMFYAFEIAIVMVLFTTFNTSGMPLVLGDIGYFLLIGAVIGAMILIYNILPFKLDAMTDGYRLTLVSNPKNKEAFNELLRVEHEISLGHTDVEVKTFDTITNFTADLNLNKVYIYLDKGEFDKALPLLEGIVNAKGNVSEKVFIRAWAQVLYINLMKMTPEEAAAYAAEKLPANISRMISEDISMEAIRAYVLVEGIVNKSKSETTRTLNNAYKAYSKTPKNRKATELSLFNAAVDKVIAAHPKWDIAEYKLEDETSK